MKTKNEKEYISLNCLQKEFVEILTKKSGLSKLRICTTFFWIGVHYFFRYVQSDLNNLKRVIEGDERFYQKDDFMREIENIVNLHKVEMWG